MDEVRRNELIERVARFVRRLSLETPAAWFLEMHKPLGFLGAQALVFFQPILSCFWDDRLLGDYALLLEEPKNIDLLLERLTHSVPKQGA